MKKIEAFRLYIILSIAGSFLTGMIFTYSSVYQVTIAQLSPLQLVLVGTVLESSVFLFEIPTGVVADVYSRRLSVIIGHFLIGLGFILEGSLPVFATILAAQVLWGVGFTFTSGATDAWISDEIGEEKSGQAFMIGARWGQVGSLFGIIGGMALAGTDVRLPIVIGGGLFLVLGVLLILFMPETGFTPTPSSERSSWNQMWATFHSGLQMVSRRPALTPILWIGFLLGLYSEGFDRLWIKLMIDHFTFPSIGALDPNAWFGIIRMVGMLLAIAVTELVRRATDTNSFSAVGKRLFAMTAMIVVAMFSFAFSPNLGFALVAFWVINALRSAINPLYTAWVNQRLDSNVRATVLSMSSQVDAIGQIVGGPGVGWIGSAISVRAAIAVSGLILTPILPLFSRTIHEGDELVTSM